MARSVESFCLFALLAVVGMRPLISERYDSATLDLTRALRDVEDASPATTLVIDGVIMLSAIGLLAVRALGGGRAYRWTGVEWGGLVVLGAAAVSCAFAGHKRLAVNGAVDWLCSLLMAVVLVQLLCDRRRIRLALCVVAASGAAQAAECFHQAFYSFPETEQMYRDGREALWASQGVALDSQQVELFESRLRSREAFGYLSHSNVTGAHLVLCGLVAVSLGWARWRGAAAPPGRLAALAAWLVAAVVLAGAVTTHSRGALIGGALAIVAWAVRVALDGVCRRHPRRVFLCGWSGVVLVGVALVGHGLYHGSLPGRSLDFRWKYWTASARMVTDHPLTGVGSLNFGRHYLQYKTIDSPEEVKNPHNFLVSAATDWGAAGVVGLFMILFGASRVLCRPDGSGNRATKEAERVRRASDPPMSPLAKGGIGASDRLSSPISKGGIGASDRLSSPISKGGIGASDRLFSPISKGGISASDRLSSPLTKGGPRGVAAYALGFPMLLATAIFLPRVWLLGSDNPNLLYFETMLPLLAWVAAFGLLHVFPLGNTVALATGLCFALAGFLLQDTLNFATLVPGTRTTACACCAIAAACRFVDQPQPSRHSVRRPRAAAGVAGVLFVLFGLLILAPVWRANAALRAARRAENAQSAIDLYHRAAELDRLDPTAFFEWSRLLFSRAVHGNGRVDAIDVAIGCVEHAIERDPIDVKLHRLSSRCHTFRASLTGDPDDRNAAVAEAEEAVALYPTDPDSHTLLADCLADRGSATSNRDDLTRAVTHYEEALRIDDARPPWEKIRRLRPARRASIAARIEAVRLRLAHPPDGS